MRRAGPRAGPGSGLPALGRARVLESRTIHHVQSLLLKHPKKESIGPGQRTFTFLYCPTFSRLADLAIHNRKILEAGWLVGWSPPREAFLETVRVTDLNPDSPGEQLATPDPLGSLCATKQPAGLVGFSLIHSQVPDKAWPTTRGSDDLRFYPN